MLFSSFPFASSAGLRPSHVCIVDMYILYTVPWVFLFEHRHWECHLHERRGRKRWNGAQSTWHRWRELKGAELKGAAVPFTGAITSNHHHDAWSIANEHLGASKYDRTCVLGVSPMARQSKCFRRGATGGWRNISHGNSRQAEEDRKGQ